MTPALFTLVVYTKKPNGYEVFLYGPGETVPTDVFCTVSHQSGSGKPDKKRLRALLKDALATKGVSLDQVANLDRF